MTAIDVVDMLEADIDALWRETVKRLDNINARAKAMYEPHEFGETCYEIPESYYREIAVHAWGVRGEQINLIKLKGKLRDLKDILENTQS